MDTHARENTRRAVQNSCETAAYAAGLQERQLVLSGDVELNPGPGTTSMRTANEKMLFAMQTAGAKLDNILQTKQLRGDGSYMRSHEAELRALQNTAAKWHDEFPRQRIHAQPQPTPTRARTLAEDPLYSPYKA